MKRLFLGLLVAGVALSASAFTNARLSVTYYQTSNGTYVLDPGTSPTGFTCRSSSSNPCTYTFTDESIASEHEEFNISELGDLANEYGTPQSGEPNKLYLPVIP